MEDVKDDDMKNHSILILDDDESIRDLLEIYLSEKYKIVKSASGFYALELITSQKIDLVLVDVNMPDMSGLEFIEQARIVEPDIAYIVISGNRDIDTAIEALHSGVWDFIQKPFGDMNSLDKIIRTALDKRELILENRRYKKNLEKMVQERTSELEKKNQELLLSRNRIVGILSRAAEFRDYETGQHFIRVSKYSGIIASGLKMDNYEADLIRQAAPVHDIGKIGIPERILLKQGKLTETEYEIMQKHCEYGEQILQSQSLENLNIPLNTVIPEGYNTDDLLTTAANIAKYHHERIDGSGYPLGLTGNDIPIEAKIVAIADVYDALGSVRSYKDAWSEKECLDYIIQNSGIHFDREVVEVFLNNIDQIQAIKLAHVDKEESHLIIGVI
ncbi:response regulator [Oceanispirochaeta crateris]|uniref:Response regulator n=2 Tax=Oceanispirochaeta crateris TaxID=2518645 RepID=A0A5C1QMM1_9SPIO|nr:response regulator [Oceanispirochaeta crateris]